MEQAMRKTDLFDAILVGGGPAELAVASETSARGRVLEFEKGLPTAVGVPQARPRRYERRSFA